jgi:hypothetical protein
MLLDHFHPPLSELRRKGFHNQSATVLAADVNSRLPQGWRAQSDVECGVEIDVGAVDEERPVDEITASAASPWTPPEPTSTIPFPGPQDIVEVRIMNRSYSPGLVGAIELVSPANMDRPDHRRAFVSQCHAKLAEGAGLIVVDIVTERRNNLHRRLMERVKFKLPGPSSDLYAAACRLTKSEPQSRWHAWEESLSLRAESPVMPLFLRVGPMAPVDLNATCLLTCPQLRIPTNVPLHN